MSTSKELFLIAESSDIEEVPFDLHLYRTREEAPKLYRVKVATTGGAKTTDFDSRGAAEEYVKLLEEIEWRPWVDREIFVCIEDPREK